ncbi:MAG: CNNM domain-containing protein [Planctomycetota bacterium]|nr:CNNM domain-containing protein [Planctomycetota bacterium]
MNLLIAVVSLTLIVSFLCSLLEAAFLSVSVASLEERRGQGVGIRWLLELKKERLDEAIGAILVLNTISNTLGATMAGFLVAREFDQYPAAVGIFSALLTFLILTCSEIIPKTLGAAHSRKLSSFVGVSLKLLTRLMKPVLIFTGLITKVLRSKSAENVSRGEVEAMIHLAGSEGTLARHEEALYRNILRLDEIRVGDVMTPRTVIRDLWQNATIGDVLAEFRRGQLPSRIPIHGPTRDEVTGYILLREVLMAHIEGAPKTTPVSKYRREIRFVPEVATLRQALADLTSGQDPIAMVADEHGGTCGLVTTEDLFETILGIEVLDEHDHPEDLRDLAQELREKRLERLRKDRVLRGPSEAGDEKKRM